LKARGWSNAALARQLESNEKRIQFLETSVEETRVAEAMLAAAPGSEAFLSNSTSGSVCHGAYTFDISFTSMSMSGSVTSRITWSEAGPMPRYIKTLHTYAEARTYDGSYVHSDADTYGPFSGLCCAGVESYARVYTSAPLLYGSTYLTVSNGCSASRFYEASSY
jgi:hypothetical protein